MEKIITCHQCNYNNRFEVDQNSYICQNCKAEIQPNDLSKKEPENSINSNDNQINTNEIINSSIIQDMGFIEEEIYNSIPLASSTDTPIRTATRIQRKREFEGQNLLKIAFANSVASTDKMANEIEENLQKSKQKLVRNPHRRISAYLQNGIIPPIGEKIVINNVDYTVMAEDQAIELILTTGQLPKNTYVHHLNLGYFPDNWADAKNWSLNTKIADHIRKTDPGFSNPNMNPFENGCTAIKMPAKPIDLSNCAFGELNLNRNIFTNALTAREIIVTQRFTAIRLKTEDRLDFTGSIFLKQCIFYQTHCQKTATFKSTHFENLTVFDESRFDDVTSFKNVDVLGDFSITASRFLDDADFTAVVMLGNTAFNKIQCYKNINFENASFHSTFDFRDSYCRGICDFDSAEFGGISNFDNSKILSTCYLTSVHFYKDSTFSRTKFSEEVSFSGTIFQGKADFYRVDVSGILDLTKTIFHNEVTFASARFGGLVRANDDPRSTQMFKNQNQAAKFLGFTRWDHATFHRSFLAFNVTFSGNASFRHCTFEDSALLGEGIFAGSIDLREVYATKEIDLHDVSVNGGIDLSNSHINGNVDLIGAKFHSLSFYNSSIDILTIEKKQLFPSEDEISDTELNKFSNWEAKQPVKLQTYRIASNYEPGKEKFFRQGKQLVAAEKAATEFFMLSKFFRDKGLRSESDWAYLIARRMNRLKCRLLLMEVTPVDDELLRLESELQSVKKLFMLVDNDKFTQPRYPKILLAKKEEFETANSESTWLAIKEQTLTAAKERINKVESQILNLKQRLSALSLKIPLKKKMKLKTKMLIDATFDRATNYGSSLSKIIGIWLLLAVLAPFYYSTLFVLKNPGAMHLYCLVSGVKHQNTEILDTDIDVEKKIDELDHSFFDAYFGFLPYSFEVQFGQGLSVLRDLPRNYMIKLFILIQTILGILLIILFAGAWIRKIVK